MWPPCNFSSSYASVTVVEEACKKRGAEVLSSQYKCINVYVLMISTAFSLKSLGGGGLAPCAPLIPASYELAPVTLGHNVDD